MQVGCGGQLLHCFLPSTRGSLYPCRVDPWPVLRGADPGFTYDGPVCSLSGCRSLMLSCLQARDALFYCT